MPSETESMACVALVTETLVTVTPLPRSAVVTPCWKLVFSPVTAIAWVDPCGPEFGVTAVRIAAPAVTQKALWMVWVSMKLAGPVVVTVSG